MNLVFISVIAVSVLQTIVCGFSLPLIFSYAARIVFLTRIVGSVVPIKVSLALEACHLFFPVLGFIMQAGTNDWVGFLLNVLFCGIASLLYIIDNANYLYIVEDDEDEE